MSSFGGVSFTVMSDSFSETTPSRVTVRAFPGGNNWAISLAGQSPVERSLPCMFNTRADYVNLVLLRGTQNTLNVDFWDPNSVSAVLTQVSASAMASSGQVLATAEFVLV